MLSTRYPHVDYDAAGVAIIAGTQTRVAEIVLDHLSQKWDARRIHQQFPGLRMGQIHAALTYYYDHEENRKQQAEGTDQNEDEESRDHSEIVRKLKCLGLLP